MNNIAIWYEATSDHPEDIDNNALLHLNINFWRSRKKNRKVSFIDLGLMISGLHKVNEVKIYLPIKDLDSNSLSDLGGLLQKKPDVLNNVFNNHCGVGTELIAYQKTINPNGGESFSLFEIDPEKHLSFSQEENGSVIGIKVYQYAAPAKDKGYFRFRVKKGSDVFTNVSETERLQFQSTKTINENIDIIIN